jgi:hypothetical protein
MASTASGSSSRQASGGQDASKYTGHRGSVKTSIPVSGDGKTPETATWSSALSLVPNTKRTYIVNALGLIPRYRRTTVEETRMAAQVYEVLDGDTYQVVSEGQLLAGPVANATMPAPISAFQHMDEVVAAENVVANGTGATTEQYNAAQAHRELLMEGFTLWGTDSKQTATPSVVATTTTEIPQMSLMVSGPDIYNTSCNY